MPPILYIVFNRPDLTRRSFECIRRAKPARLYVAADGPRPGREGEPELCQRAREITEAIDWDCDVTRLYADENIGCGIRISSAITQTLVDDESVIVLEDDCLPDPSFFSYCDQLLDRYADDQRIMAVSGDNFQQGMSRTPYSYYFSKYPHGWGWATWRRAWQHFSYNIPMWPAFRDAGGLDGCVQSVQEHDYWTSCFDRLFSSKQVDIWDLQWTLCCWMQHGLTTLPDVNLVSNVGFDGDGTHTIGKTSYAELPTHDLPRIDHPTAVCRHDVADRFTDALVFSGRQKNSLRHQFRRWRRRKANAVRAAA